MNEKTINQEHRLQAGQPYEAPSTVRTHVVLEHSLLAQSKEKVVKDDNTQVDITQHDRGGDFVLNDWNE